MRWTASQLNGECGYRNVLRKIRTISPSAQRSIDIGNVFHAAVDRWFTTGDPPYSELPDVQAWLGMLEQDFVGGLPARRGSEVAWGLSPEGRHVMVEEPEPHVYRSIDGSKLLTAGRADAYWFHADDGRLMVVDWKSGAWPVTPAKDNLQAIAAGLALADRFHAPAFQSGIYYAREVRWDWGPIIEHKLPTADWPRTDWSCYLADVKAAAELDETPRPGAHCGKCWERKVCHAAPVAP